MVTTIQNPTQSRSKAIKAVAGQIGLALSFGFAFPIAVGQAVFEGPEGALAQALPRELTLRLFAEIWLLGAACLFVAIWVVQRFWKDSAHDVDPIIMAAAKRHTEFFNAVRDDLSELLSETTGAGNIYWRDQSWESTATRTLRQVENASTDIAKFVEGADEHQHADQLNMQIQRELWSLTPRLQLLMGEMAAVPNISVGQLRDVIKLHNFVANYRP